MRRCLKSRKNPAGRFAGSCCQNGNREGTYNIISSADCIWSKKRKCTVKTAAGIF